MPTVAPGVGTTASLQIINIPTLILYTYAPTVYIYIYFFYVCTGTLAQEKATGAGLTFMNIMLPRRTIIPRLFGGSR